jgi:uncharacterized protein YlxP (DUF503 family)
MERTKGNPHGREILEKVVERVVEVEPVLVKPRTAFAMIEVSTTTGYDLMKKGVLDIVFVNGDRRVTVESVKRLAASKAAA